MKKLTEYFNKHQNDFNTEDMPEGHENRFKNKLLDKKRRKTVKLYYKFAAMAAVLLIPIALLIFMNNPKFITGKSNQAINTSTNLPVELKEVQMFYEKSIDNKITELNTLLCDNAEVNSNAVLKDLYEVDVVNKQLLFLLQQNTKNEIIINALIQNYQTKAAILDKVIVSIKENC